VSGVLLLALPQKATKGLGPEPPKTEKPGDIPKIRKLATLKQYGFFLRNTARLFSCGTLFPAKAAGLRGLRELPSVIITATCAEFCT
jgi:hypothetical protein